VVSAHPLATLGPEIAARTVTLMAPSKTITGGLNCGFAIIQNPVVAENLEKGIALGLDSQRQ